jgi:large subunit ribosomal protein L22
MMEARSVIKYVRISPQKIRKIIGPIKGKSVENALNSLKFMPQKAATFVEKALRSAVANADQIFKLDVDTLVVRNICVDQGPVLKRFRARARGRGARILKRTSHITVIVTEENF